MEWPQQQTWGQQDQHRALTLRLHRAHVTDTTCFSLLGVEFAYSYLFFFFREAAVACFSSKSNIAPLYYLAYFVE